LPARGTRPPNNVRSHVPRNFSQRAVAGTEPSGLSGRYPVEEVLAEAVKAFPNSRVDLDRLAISSVAERQMAMFKPPEYTRRRQSHNDA
jgi:hypothetical protein